MSTVCPMRPLRWLPTALLFAIVAPGTGVAQPPGLVTRWAAEVDTAAPLPDHPRPQLVRPGWRSLNGWWDYAVRDSAAPRPDTWDGRILVPFPIESQLSRVRRTVGERERLWYRRTFPATVPAGHRLLLHFGAVDWEAVVFVNGARVGEHRGGYDPFTVDITDALTAAGAQELVVAVWDPTDAGDQPRGKQVREPRGIWYTAVTGIWQTVWLETVPQAYVQDIDVAADLDSARAEVRVYVAGAGDGERVYAAAYDGLRRVAETEGAPGAPLTLTIPDPRAWSPDDPFLYDLRIRLASGDSVTGYFGMRTIAVARDSLGVRRLFLNGRPLFHYGLLDQGWWPDGLYTAPTDAALRSDIEVTRRLGFNMARKHVKVEPARWYYHADRLGLLVWQDMPSARNRTESSHAQFAVELQRMVDALRDHPSIVMWVPFNEGWGQHDTERYTAWLQTYDTTRLVNSASGWTDRGTGDVWDVHAYPGPASPGDDERRARVLGEFGGLGLPLEGHTWLERDNWGYRSYADTAALGDAYRALLHQLRFLIGDGLAAAVYTQTTDVEIEVNGVMTYDRAVVKLPADAPAVHAALHAPAPRVRGVVATSRAEGQRWRYTTEAPSDTWAAPDFDDAAWREGLGGFGRTPDPGTRVRTPWTTDHLWLRRTFTLGPRLPAAPHLIVRHDEDVEIYVNGHPAAALTGYNQAYVVIPLSADARASLRPGVNTLAVHVRQTRGAQYVDVGLVDVDPSGTPEP